MPPLTRQQVAALHSALMALRKQFQFVLDNSAEGGKPVGLDQPIGRLSRMDAMQQQSMTQANQRIARVRLAQVEAALQRISQGEYGSCVDCGEDVGYARLEARPETPFCFDCQSWRERR